MLLKATSFQLAFGGMLNLDTHIVVFAVTDELRPNERALLEREPWSASAMVFWELSKLIQLGRIALNLDSPAATRVISKLHVWPVDMAVARATASLDFRSDPADELIAATSVVHGVPLLTRDHLLRASNVVPLAL